MTVTRGAFAAARPAPGHLATAVPRARYDWATVVDGAVECLSGPAGPAELRALAMPAVTSAFAAHLADQATWPERTDSDRLTDAFRALDQAGIVAREDFACCQNCGVAEIVAAGVPCFQGTCSEVYLEKAFEGTAFAPPQRLPLRPVVSRPGCG